MREDLLGDELIDLLVARSGTGGPLTGEGGFLPELVRSVLERGLAVELKRSTWYA